MDPSITSTNTDVTPPVYSAEDFIAWTLEEAHSMGKIGFSTNFPNTAANFSAWRCDLNAPPEPADEHQALEDAAEATHAEFMRTKTRCELMQKMPNLLAEAHSIVDARLLAAGRLQPAGDDRDLRQKVTELFELENPPAAANFISVLVAQGAFSQLDKLLEVKWRLPSIRLAFTPILMNIQVNLPLKEPLTGIYDLLKGAIELDARFRDPLGPKKEVKSGTWKYQVLYPDNFSGFQNIDQPSVWLQTDEDYRWMVRRICDADKQAFHIVLMQVSLRLRHHGKHACSLAYLDFRNLFHKSK